METPKRREARGWLAMEGSLTVEQLPLAFLTRQPPIATRAATRGSRRRSACRHQRGPAPQTPAARVPSGPVVGGDDLVRGYGLRRHEAELERREACWSRAGDPQLEDALGRVARRAAAAAEQRRVEPLGEKQAVRRVGRVVCRGPVWVHRVGRSDAEAAAPPRRAPAGSDRPPPQTVPPGRAAASARHARRRLPGTPARAPGRDGRRHQQAVMVAGPSTRLGRRPRWDACQLRVE
eukprot:scaffold42495_cov64-Phaeocystis_antarctica.AAC.5